MAKNNCKDPIVYNTIISILFANACLNTILLDYYRTSYVKF